MNEIYFVQIQLAEYIAVQTFRIADYLIALITNWRWKYVSIRI